MIAATKILSPTLKSFTKDPTSTISPQASCPKTISNLSPTPPSYTVCISEVHGANANGFIIASVGPHTGLSFVIQPTSPIFFITNAFICSAIKKPPELIVYSIK